MSLTQVDLVEIERIIDEKLDEKLKYVPSKELFLQWMDKIMGELKTVREEHVILSGMLSEDSDRLEVLEKIHPGGKHLSAS